MDQKKSVFLLFLVWSPICGFSQISAGGIQFSGVLSANVIDDINSNTAYADNNNGYSYLQLNGSFKDGPFGLESQLQFGPAPSDVTGVSNFYFHYGYGYANFGGGVAYLAVGRIIDLSTFGLNSYYQIGPNGPGVYGSTVGKTGLSGFGIDGFELRVTPLANLVLGIVMPYNINPGFDIVNSTLKNTRFVASYTFPKILQFVLGYQQHLVGVADYLPPPSTQVDPNTEVNRNKAYALANLLVSDNLTAGVRYELDHSVSAFQIISNNGYATLGEKIGNASVGVDAGIFVPASGSAGVEILGAASYTFPSVLPSVDLQPYLQVGFFSSGYPMVSDLPGATYTNGFNNDNYIMLNPEVKLLLGKSQHELELGYTISYDRRTAQITLDQLNMMVQIYF